MHEGQERSQARVTRGVSKVTTATQCNVCCHIENPIHTSDQLSLRQLLILYSTCTLSHVVHLHSPLLVVHLFLLVRPFILSFSPTLHATRSRGGRVNGTRRIEKKRKKGKKKKRKLVTKGPKKALIRSTFRITSCSLLSTLLFVLRYSLLPNTTINITLLLSSFSKHKTKQQQEPNPLRLCFGIDHLPSGLLWAVNNNISVFSCSPLHSLTWLQARA